VISAK